MRFEKSFIAATEEYSDYNKRVPAPYIRGSFDLKKCPKAAEITITALGFYEDVYKRQRFGEAIPTLRA